MALIEIVSVASQTFILKRALFIPAILMSIEHVNTLVIGGGQAGLAMSHMLKRRGVEHLVLERNRIAERWRSQ